VRKKKTKQPENRRPYSWKEERRASRECIRWAIRRALVDKIHALKGESRTDACDLIIRAWERDRRASLLSIARGKLNYLRLRAFMPGAYSGYPGDRPATDRWNKLNPQARRNY
jgi:hypothetical protein